MRIFISHVHEELPIAKVLKQQFQVTFGAMVEVFLSEDIRLGDNWLGTIKSALQSADFIFVLFSKTSHSRSWINIEAGYGIMAEKAVVPICCLGLKKDALSVVYGLQQSMYLTDAADVLRLLDMIGALTPAKCLLGDDKPKIIERWISAVKCAEARLPSYSAPRDAPILIWLIGSVTDVPELFQDRAFKTADAVSASFVAAGYRVVMGRTRLLNYIADRVSYESLNREQVQTGEIPQLLATKSARATNASINPIIILGSLRSTDGIRRMFVDCIGRIPDVAVMLGGALDGRAADEAHLAVDAGIPLLPLQFTGGAAALTVSTFDSTLAPAIAELQAAARGSDTIGERICGLVSRQVQITRTGTGVGGEPLRSPD